MSIKSLSVFAVLKNNTEKGERKGKKESEQLTKKGMKEQSGTQKEAADETKAF